MVFFSLNGGPTRSHRIQQAPRRLATSPKTQTELPPPMRMGHLYSFFYLSPMRYRQCAFFPRGLTINNRPKWIQFAFGDSMHSFHATSLWFSRVVTRLMKGICCMCFFFFAFGKSFKGPLYGHQCTVQVGRDMNSPATKQHPRICICVAARRLICISFSECISAFSDECNSGLRALSNEFLKCSG